MTHPSKTSLSVVDVERLQADRSVEARIGTMAKLVLDLGNGGLQGRESDMARDLLLRFSRDAEAAVREAVAWQIHNSPLLSDDLARQLAHDVACVAFPILRHATLTDDLLLEVIGDRDPQKQVAIAGRANVSAVVADAIVETANLMAIGTLLRNDTAEIGPPTLEKVADRYGEVPFVAEPLAARPHLPLTVVETLVHRVSEDIRHTLAERYRLTPEVVADLVARGREAATLLMIQPLTRGAADVELLAHHLHLNKRLTPEMLFRALCCGDIGLFVAGMAVRAGVATDNARRLIFDDGQMGLKALFTKSGLSTLIVPPFRVAIKVVKEMGFDGEDERRRHYQITVLARVYNECGHIEERAVDDLLMQLFDQKSADMIDQAMDMAGMPFVPLRAEEVAART